MSRIYKVKYLQPTNTKGARISISDISNQWDINRTILDRDYTFNNFIDQALDYVHSIKVSPLLSCFKDGDVEYLIFE